MQIRHRAAALAAVSGIVLSDAAGVAPALAADAPSNSTKPAPTMTFMTRGMPAAVNGHYLTVASDGGTNQITVAPDAAITVNGTAAKLAPLPLGAQITAAGTTMVAIRIEVATVQPFAVAGSVAAVDGTTTGGVDNTTRPPCGELHDT